MLCSTDFVDEEAEVQGNFIKFKNQQLFAPLYIPLGKTCQSINDTSVKHIQISETLKCEKEKSVSYNKICK